MLSKKHLGVNKSKAKKTHRLQAMISTKAKKFVNKLTA